MNKLYIMIGLPGSGKSTYAEKIMKSNNNAILVSSDDFRSVLLKDVHRQNENSFIFRSMDLIAIQGLKDNKDVIYDATNLECLKRRALVSKIRREVDKPIEVIGIYCVANYKSASANNLLRERQVPDDVILRLAKKFDIPNAARDCYLDDLQYYCIEDMEDSNINEILTAKDYETFSQIMIRNSADFADCCGLAQDNKYHTLSVSRHIYESFKYAQKNIPEQLKGYQTHILYALAFHDTGKAICKEVRPGSKYAHFTGHEKLSAQNFIFEASRLQCLAENESLDMEFIAALIKEHMVLHYENPDDIAATYGNDFKDCLIFMHLCDTNGK